MVTHYRKSGFVISKHDPLLNAKLNKPAVQSENYHRLTENPVSSEKVCFRVRKRSPSEDFGARRLLLRNRVISNYCKRTAISPEGQRRDNVSRTVRNFSEGRS